LFFAVNLSGHSAALQRQREVSFKDGEAVLLSGANGGFSVIRPTPARFVGLRMSQKQLAPLARGLDNSRMRVIPANAAPLRLLASYVDAIADMAEPISAEMSGVIAAHLHDLVALSVGPTQDAVAAAEGSVRAARLQAIKRDIAARLLEESDLTVAAIAARHQVTPRYVHKLFERDGTTVTRFVLEQRLDHAYRRLRNPQFSACSISSIAYDVGFGDLSYFNRVFRRRYGATPSDIRQLA
jgi:AraC-like DNA-binding protein